MDTRQLFRRLLIFVCCGAALATLWAGEPQGTATAFVVGKDGYLLTCAHVVKDAGNVVVTIGGEAYYALVLGQDEQHDLALLQIDAKDLPTMALANSDAVEVGQEVRAFGFPLASLLGGDIKVTRGTIAGVSMREAQKVFQIDAAVNPGNSGGPLVNEKGEVIGVTNAKLAHVVVSNVAFAVPINYAQQLLRRKGAGLRQEGGKEKLDGPALVKRVSPSVALVTVWPPDTRIFDLGGGVKLEVVLIHPGSFLMGSEDGQETEKPVHKVTIANSFYIGKYEATQEQWKAVMGSNPGHITVPKNPVEKVSWVACQEFIRKLNAKTGRKFSLPTEAQWEYACRAGTTTPYSFDGGEPALAEYAWFVGNSGSRLHPVGEKKPNAWGLFDMHGNVREWCQDVWHDSYEGAPADGSAWLSGDDGADGDDPDFDVVGKLRKRVARGGQAGIVARHCRSASRTGWFISLAPIGGFRVCLADF